MSNLELPAAARRTLITAGLLLGIATALGAFGFHNLRPVLPPARFESFSLAVTYQFFQSLGLLGIGLLQARQESNLLRWAARLILVGLLLFGGSIYAMTFGAPKILGAVAPLGGLSLMAAWVTFAVAVARMTGGARSA
jgi:uncharacterized membrane protein YgdD (TMEM256/DUF423 family)